MTATSVDGAPVDPGEIEAFLGRLTSIYAGSMLSYMIDIGHRTGLFTAAAAAPATSEALAERAGLTERYVREWLGAMVTGGIVDYDAPARTYYLNREQSFQDQVFKFDYTATFEMKGGTTVHFFSDGGGNEGHYTAYGDGGPHSCTPTPPGITKQPYLGQFLHIQVKGTQPAK